MTVHSAACIGSSDDAEGSSGVAIDDGSSHDRHVEPGPFVVILAPTLHRPASNRLGAARIIAASLTRAAGAALAAASTGVLLPQ